MSKLIIAAKSFKIYYHYSDRKFEIGDIITGHDYSSDIANDIIKIYVEYTKMNKISSALYMLDEVSEEYKNNYKYGYIVYPLNRVLKCQMDYSLIICNAELERCCKYFINNNPNESVENCRAMYIDLMASAYVGDNTSKTFLEKCFNYKISDKLEYICQEAEVIRTF